MAEGPTTVTGHMRPRQALHIDRLASYLYAELWKLDDGALQDIPRWFEIPEHERELWRARIVACISGNFGPTLAEHRPYDKGDNPT